METTKHLRIMGKVQGVGYRIWAQQTAERYNLKGWARNRLDGSVEILITGKTKDIANFITSCYEGPDLAVVDEIITRNHDYEPVKGFEIRKSG